MQDIKHKYAMQQSSTQITHEWQAEAKRIISSEVHELPLDPSMHHSKRPSPPLASIAKKINPSVAEAVVVGRRAGVD